MKYIFGLLLGLSSLLVAQEGSREEYLDFKQLELSDIRIFGGLEGGYNYLQSNSGLDTSGYSYGAYVGIPIKESEIIIKKKQTISNDMSLDTLAGVFNFPISGTGSRALYLGILGGDARIINEESVVASKQLQNATTDGSFFGAHIGKRYKFGQNFFVRIEFEYLKYDIVAPSQTLEGVDLENSFEFIYGLEYRF